MITDEKTERGSAVYYSMIQLNLEKCVTLVEPFSAEYWNLLQYYDNDKTCIKILILYWNMYGFE